jgi:uncharacterized protein (TIGR00661 family)
MKIAYGVCGYGRGHVTRALAILEELSKRHEVLVFAGGNAYDFLSKKFILQKTPVIRFVYNRGRSRFSKIRTIQENYPHVRELMKGQGSFIGEMIKRFEDFQPDAVVSDFEHWSRRVAGMLGLPLIHMDHGGILAFCDLDIPRSFKAEKAAIGYLYRAVLGSPDRIIVSSFYEGRPNQSNVSVIGPVVRSEVKSAVEHEGDHLLVYLNQSESFTKRLYDCLANLHLPVHIYGANEFGNSNGLKFCKLDPEGFVEDMASCRAVISRGGNQLFGETLWLHKPVLAFPENTIEQRINAYFVEKMGIGMQGELSRVSEEIFDGFINHLEIYKENTKKFARDSHHEAVGIIDGFLNSRL